MLYALACDVLNPVAWKLRSTEGYRLSRPVGSKVTNLLYIDDLKVFTASQAKLDRVLKMTKEAMEDVGLQWNPKTCNVLNVRRGVPVDVPEGFKSGATVIDSLKEDNLPVPRSTGTATLRREPGSASCF